MTRPYKLRVTYERGAWASERAMTSAFASEQSRQRRIEQLTGRLPGFNNVTRIQTWEVFVKEHPV